MIYRGTTIYGNPHLSNQSGGGHPSWTEEQPRGAFDFFTVTWPFGTPLRRLGEWFVMIPDDQLEGGYSWPFLIHSEMAELWQ